MSASITEELPPKKAQKMTEEKATKTAKFALHPYIYFPGTANDAIDFYAAILNATVPIRSTFQDLPQGLPEEVPSENKHHIMHAELRFGENNVIMISDNSQCETVTQGTNVQLTLAMSDLEETTRIFNGLAVGGTITMPLQKQFWGATFGKLTDRFNIVWNLNCEDCVADEEQKNEDKKD